MTGPRSAAAAILALVAGAALCAPAAASAVPASAAGCDDGSGVTVVLDPNEVGGPDRTTCVPSGGAAAELLDRAGLTLEYQPGLQDFVCRIDGRPTDRPCTSGDSYWSLWWAEPAGEWTYATLGVRSLEVPEGGMLGFAWHEGDAEAAPPDVPAGGPGAPGRDTPSSTAADAGDDPAGDTAGDPAGDTAGDTADDGAGFPWWAAAVAVVVLGAAAAVPVLRRRRSA